MTCVQKLLVALMAIITVGCAHRQIVSPQSSASPDIAGKSDGSPRVLRAEDGEHRVRRVGGVARFTIKIDPVTTHSPDFVMVAETIPVGGRIPAHVHPAEDEIIFIHSGSGTVDLGTQHDSVAIGATVYVPRSTRIAVRNTGDIPLEIIAIFSHPGFEEYLRDTSVPEGQMVVPLTSAELTAVRQRHAAHVLWERP